MVFSDAIKGFELSLSADRYSLRTIEAYKAHLSHLALYLGNPNVTRVTDKDLQKYFIYLVNDYQPKRFNHDPAPLAGSSVNKIWIATRSFFRWATLEFQLANNPALSLKQPDYTTKTIAPFNQAEILRLLKRATPRNQVIILILLDTGLRVGELCRLLVKDANLETGEINIAAFGSGQKTKARTVYIGKAARRALWRYQTGRDNQPSTPLILSNHRQPMTRNAVRCLLADLGVRAGVANVHPHRFRHTFAIQYLRNGGDVFTLQRLLGHSSLEMVRHYLALAQADDSNAHQGASPVDRWGL